MDPWYPHPWEKDRLCWPDIDQHNQITMERLIQYLPKLNRVAVSMPGCFTVHPALAHLVNTGNNPTKTLALVNQYNINHIVYTGFHLGRCIINKGDGAKNMSQKPNLHLWCKLDLCSVFPDQTQIEAKDACLPYLTLIP